MFHKSENRIVSILGTIGLSAFLILGCDRQTDQVGAEIEDLKEARQNTQGEVQRLSEELEEAKQDVVDLEEKLALAERGLTDEVLRERAELADALKKQGKEVKQEVNEAQGAAQQHSKHTGQAEQLLQETQPPKQVKGEVQSQSEVVPDTSRVRSGSEEERVIISKVRGVDEEEEDATITEDAGDPEPLEPLE